MAAGFVVCVIVPERSAGGVDMNKTQQVEELKARVELVDQEIGHFVKFLNGPKFTGTERDADGVEHRKDWISTKDVLAQLQVIRDTLQREVSHETVESFRSLTNLFAV